MQLHTLQGRHRCESRWKQADRPPWGNRWIRVGRLLDRDRWYVEVTAEASHPARLYPDRQAAYSAVERIMAHYGGDWEQIPCYPMEAAVEEARRRARERQGP